MRVLWLCVLSVLCISCVSQTFLEEGGKWVPYMPKRRPPLKVEVEGPAQVAKLPFSPEEFLKDCQKTASGKLVKFYRCQYQTTKSLLPVIRKHLSPKGSVYYHAPTSTFVITDTKKGLLKVGKALSQLDIPSPQVRIRVRVIELLQGRQWEHGIDYTHDRSNTTSSFMNNLVGLSSTLNPKNFLDSLKPGANAFQGTVLKFQTHGKRTRGDIDVVVRLFQELGSANVDASPDILVSEGKVARILSGEEIPFISANVNGNRTIYTTRFKPVGISLMVKPEQISHREVKLYVKSEVSVVTSWTDPSLVGGISNPVISKRATETTIQAKDGEIFLFGGLIVRRRMLVRRSLPLLGDIPILGHLFSATRYESTYSQLTFLLSVEIVNGQGQQDEPASRTS